MVRRITVEAKITQLRGAKAYTGATLRLLNVAADQRLGFGVFDSAGATGDIRDLLKDFNSAVTSTYGVAGPAFVNALVSRAEATPHSARHSFISTLQAQGVEVGLVAKLAGHKNAVVTLSHYTHAMRGGEEAVKALDRAYAGTTS